MSGPVMTSNTSQAHHRSFRLVPGHVASCARLVVLHRARPDFLSQYLGYRIGRRRLRAGEGGSENHDGAAQQCHNPHSTSRSSRGGDECGKPMPGFRPSSTRLDARGALRGGGDGGRRRRAQRLGDVAEVGARRVAPARVDLGAGASAGSPWLTVAITGRRDRRASCGRRYRLRRASCGRGSRVGRT